MASNISAGKIAGSPLCGLCERVCIRVKKITDGCVSRLTNVKEENVRLSLNGSVAPIPPFTFVSAENIVKPAMQNLSVSTMENNRVRISYDAAFPVTVTFIDSLNRTFTATGTVVVPRDVVLKIPSDGREYAVEIDGKLLSRLGSVDENLFTTFTCCIAIITAIAVSADLLVPSYGECVYPDCNNYDDGACRAVFNTPPFGNVNS